MEADDLGLLKETNFQFGSLLWVLNLIGNNAFRRGGHLTPLLNTPNGTIVTIVSFSLSQQTHMDTHIKKHLNALNQWLLQSIVQMNSDKLHVVAKETALLP